MLLAAAAALLIAVGPAHATDRAIIDAAQASDTLRVGEIHVDDATLHARISNDSDRAITGVRLLVRHTFHWNDDFHPGADNPGSAYTMVLTETIPPGGEVPLSATIRPLPVRDDGWFVTDVMVVGFTQIG
jgi:hypothetical protein